MNDASDNARVRGKFHDSGPDRFDQVARSHYERSLQAIPPATLAHLRAARHQAARHASPPRRLGWLLAGGCAMVFAVAITVQLRPGPTADGIQTVATDTGLPLADARIDAADSAIAALDENPDLYLWLASNDDALPPPAGQWP